jgi:hypothetical protein
MQDLNQLAKHLLALADSAGDIAPWSGQTYNKPAGYRVRYATCHHDRNRFRRPLCSVCGLPSANHDHINVLHHEFVGKAIHSIRIALGVDG